MSFTYSDFQHRCPQRRLSNHLRKDALEVILVHANQACEVVPYRKGLLKLVDKCSAGPRNAPLRLRLSTANYIIVASQRVKLLVMVS